MIKTIAVALALCLSVIGCNTESRERTDQKKEYSNYDAGGTPHVYYVLPNGLECVALGVYGMSGRGLSCNWEKLNHDREANDGKNNN